jgi:hypothetical protein
MAMGMTLGKEAGEGSALFRLPNTITFVISVDPQDNPSKLALLSHLTDEEAEIKRSKVTFPKPHN